MTDVIAALAVLTPALSRPATTGEDGYAGPVPAFSGYDFTVELYQGEDVIGSRSIQFETLLGDKPIVLNYWASNCAPCSAEMPGFERVWQRYQGQVLFFGMDVGRFAGFGGPEDSKRELLSWALPIRRPQCQTSKQRRHFKFKACLPQTSSHPMEPSKEGGWEYSTRPS